MKQENQDTRIRTSRGVKEDWAEPKVKWVKPELVRLNGDGAEGKYYISSNERGISYAPS